MQNMHDTVEKQGAKKMQSSHDTGRQSEAKKMQSSHYIAKKIIERSEYHSAKDWIPGAAGGRTLKIQQSDYTACGKTILIEEILRLEAQGLIDKVKWIIRGSDVERIFYRLEMLPAFYRLLETEEGFVPKWKQIQRYQSLLKEELAHGVKKEWIRAYYQSLVERLEQVGKGKIPKEYEKLEVYISCFRGLDRLEEPVFKRIFSKAHLKHSKTFEKVVQSHIISVAKNFHPDVEPDMDDTSVLEQILIEEYAQEMALKGPLHLQIQGEGKTTAADCSAFCYGMVLNSETLKHARLDPSQPDIRKVVTIENKANFVSTPYEANTLYIFSHGYFSPREREFLQNLERILELQEAPVEYAHSGDLDYGGVKIFEYIQKRIFPKLQPLKMDVDTFERYQMYAEEIEEEKLKKLQETQVPELQGLIRKILETKLGIEQEAFLIPTGMLEIDGGNVR